MAREHLGTSLTKGNLWLYILPELQLNNATPGDFRSRVLDKNGFAPAAITFYSVIYRLRREGVVKRSSDFFRSAYTITPKGREEFLKALSYLDEVQKSLTQTWLRILTALMVLSRKVYPATTATKMTPQRT